MSGYRLSARAGRDLREIGHYSVRQWGEVQADRYVRGLIALFDRLADSPTLWRDRAAIRPGLLQTRYERHVVFFRVVRKQANIVRILHGAMDFTRHL